MGPVSSHITRKILEVGMIGELRSYVDIRSGRDSHNPFSLG